MSASLVGSEMCIRDRRPAAGQRCYRATDSCTRSTSSLCRPLALLHMRRCLLYTSDAADDM
eukprot:10418446-Alexandrium_andersonii.AAC.1